MPYWTWLKTVHFHTATPCKKAWMFTYTVCVKFFKNLSMIFSVLAPLFGGKMYYNINLKYLENWAAISEFYKKRIPPHSIFCLYLFYKKCCVICLMHIWDLYNVECAYFVAVIQLKRLLWHIVLNFWGRESLKCSKIKWIKL
jgi:hypothetical protein